MTSQGDNLGIPRVMLGKRLDRPCRAYPEDVERHGAPDTIRPCKNDNTAADRHLESGFQKLNLLHPRIPLSTTRQHSGATSDIKFNRLINPLSTKSGRGGINCPQGAASTFEPVP